MRIRGLMTTALLYFLLLSTGGCADLEESTPAARAGCETYSNHGFSFEYPKGFPVTEQGLLQSEADNLSGVVMVAADSTDEGYFTVSWIETDTYSLEGSLEGTLAGILSKEGVASCDRGELVQTSHAGHRVLYRYYAATSVDGEEVHGVMGTFFCDTCHRAYGLSTVASDLISKGRVIQGFQDYLDSFVCH
jgi:hypothetical protein